MAVPFLYSYLAWLPMSSMGVGPSALPRSCSPPSSSISCGVCASLCP